MLWLGARTIPGFLSSGPGNYDRAGRCRDLKE